MLHRGGRWSGAGTRSRATALSAAALVAACSSAAQDAPLVSAIVPAGFTYCQAPIRTVGLTWDSRIGFTTFIYFNQAREPVTVESVRLLNPHNLASHQGLVYEMPRSLHPLTSAAAWQDLGHGAPPAQWAARQVIPGAVIKPGHGLPPGMLPSPRFDMWEIAVDVSAIRPGGGWALGEVVTYRAGATTYTVTAEDGIAVGSGHAEGSPSAEDGNCAAQLNAVTAAFKHHR